MKKKIVMISGACLILGSGFFALWQTSTEDQEITIPVAVVEDRSEQKYSEDFSYVEANGVQVTPEEWYAEEEKEMPQKMQQEVIFVVQAPLAQWENELFQDACEEASVIMVNAWVDGQKKNYSKNDATEELKKMFLFEKQKYGQAFDLSAADTMKLLKDYYSVQDIELFYDIDSNDIVQALANGKLVIVPSNGQKLGNPYFTAPGPERHMLVITGYDQKKKEFITNDPGTRRGEDYRYSYETLIASVRDYPTGHKEPIVEEKTAMIVVGRSLERE